MEPQVGSLERTLGAIKEFFCHVYGFFAGNLVKTQQCIFNATGVAKEVTSDRDTGINGQELQEFHVTWGEKHRQSSSHTPHSKHKAKVAVKIVKRILADCTRNAMA